LLFEPFTKEYDTLYLFIGIVSFQGDFDPRQTKVLHYSVNPFSTERRKLTAELEKLREENRRLTKRIQIVEESRDAAVSDLSARVDSELHASSGKEVEGIVALRITVGGKNTSFLGQPG